MRGPYISLAPAIYMGKLADRFGGSRTASGGMDHRIADGYRYVGVTSCTLRCSPTPFSRPYLKGKKWYAGIGFTSMYFSGGLIPSFMLINWLGMYDSYWVYIIPSLFGGFFNVIILNANYKAIPDSLFESAKMDGASEFRIFFQIVLPLSKPVLAALSVFTAVGVWNDYGTTLYFTQSSHLQTVQYMILKLLQTSSAAEQMAN